MVEAMCNDHKIVALGNSRLRFSMRINDRYECLHLEHVDKITSVVVVKEFIGTTTVWCATYINLISVLSIQYIYGKIHIK